MHSIKDLLDMVATEAAFGPEEGYVDYQRSYSSPRTSYEPKPAETLPSVQYNLRLVRNPDGTLDWKD